MSEESSPQTEGLSPIESSPEIADEMFWLSRGAAVVKESPEKLDKGAQQIASAMAWFWTAYSSVLAAALWMSDSHITWQTSLLIAAPAISLFISYSLAVWASLPISLQFDPAAPYEIKAVHEIVVNKKQFRLGMSLVLAGISALLIATMLVAISLFPKRSHDAISIALFKTAKGPELIVGGALPAKTEVLIRVTPVDHETQRQLMVAEKDKHFTTAFPVAPAEAYDVEISWKIGERRTTLQEEVKSQ
jgi:hypothetical protein